MKLKDVNFSKAQWIAQHATSFSDALNLADEHAVDRDQDWDTETTTFTFDDGSKLRCCYPFAEAI